MRLIKIPDDKYYNYRINAMFDCYKWDPQFYDSNTLSNYILVLSKEEDLELVDLTEKIDKETIEAEEFLINNISKSKKLKMPLKIYNNLKNVKNYDKNRNIRLMRYDFHPTQEGRWVVSEVNSDVPGGFAESSILPELAKNTIGNKKINFRSFGDLMVNEITKNIRKNGTIMMCHCTCYSDDRQVMQYLGDKLEKVGYKVLYGAADHIKFINNKAYSILDNNNLEIDLIFRFTPIEWLIKMRIKNYKGYFNTLTSSCNHPIAVFAQTKRFPFIWNDLEEYGLKFNNWRNLLPKTYEVKMIKKEEDIIFKPVYGRVGEKISIKEACKDDEYKKILKDVKMFPNKYIAQKKFISKPLITEKGEKLHLCLGSYTINGKQSGYYARVSKLPRIDSYAADIPVLIEE